MLLAVANNDQATFNGLWKFYNDYLDSHSLMNWSVHTSDAPGNNNSYSATDGDLDAAMALVQADKKWGGYTSAALTQIHNIKAGETETCSVTISGTAHSMTVLRPGDNWGGCSDNSNPGKVDPSYFAPGYYRVFAQVDSANSAFWTQFAADTYLLLAAWQTQSGGLSYNWGNVDNVTSPYDSSYGYDACRVPWRVAVDYLWFCTPAAQTFLTNVSTYVDAHGGISGVPFDKNSAFLGAFALSGMSVSQAKLDGYVSSWVTTATPQDNVYFQGSLRLLYALVGGGTFSSTL